MTEAQGLALPTVLRGRVRGASPPSVGAPRRGV